MPKTYTHTFSLPANVGLGIVSLTRTLTSLDSQTTFLFYVTDSVHIPLCYMSVHVTASTHIHLPTYIHKHLPIVFLYISVTSWGKGEFDWATINMFWQLERGGGIKQKIFSIFGWIDGAILTKLGAPWNWRVERMRDFLVDNVGQKNRFLPLASFRHSPHWCLRPVWPEKIAKCL